MQIFEIKDKREWENFLLGCTEKTFFQSWNWGEFNIAMGNKIWRFGIDSEGRTLAASLVLKISAKRGTFLFIPHGPAVAKDNDPAQKKEIFNALLNHLIALAKKEGADFIRISSLLLLNPENERIFSDLRFRPSPMHASSYEATWKLDISASEQELLKNMRKTTRYLVRKTAEDKDIEIVKSKYPEDIVIYQELNKAVSKRQGFVPFSDELIKKEFEIFLKDNQAMLLLGKYLPAGRQGKGEIAAGCMLIFWQGIAFYHQAASFEKFAKYSIPYFLQWQAIKEAKRRGCATYDFWGFTDPKKFPKHPWAGPTLFKMGFGGYKAEYVKTQDYIVSWRYWINYIIEKIRKFKRGL